MAGDGVTWRDVGDILEAISKAIVTFVTFVYSNILWLILVTMLANVVIFFSLHGDVSQGSLVLRLWAGWNLLILISLTIRFIETPEFR